MSCAMAHSRMPRVWVRRTAAGERRRQELLHPQKTSSCGHKLRRWDDPGQVDGSFPQEGGGTWSRLAYTPGLCKTSRLFLPNLGSPCAAGVSWSCSRDATYLSCRTRLASFPNLYGLCWSLSFWRHVLAELKQSTALRYPALLVGRLCHASFPARCSPWLPPKPRACRGGP